MTTAPPRATSEHSEKPTNAARLVLGHLHGKGEALSRSVQHQVWCVVHEGSGGGTTVHRGVAPCTKRLFFLCLTLANSPEHGSFLTGGEAPRTSQTTNNQQQQQRHKTHSHADRGSRGHCPHVRHAVPTQASKSKQATDSDGGTRAGPGIRESGDLALRTGASACGGAASCSRAARGSGPRRCRQHPYR